MKRVLFAMGAIFVQFDTIGIVFLVFITVVVSVFAFCASQNNFYAHFPHLLLCGPGKTGNAVFFSPRERAASRFLFKMRFSSI